MSSWDVLGLAVLACWALGATWALGRLWCSYHDLRDQQEVFAIALTSLGGTLDEHFDEQDAWQQRCARAVRLAASPMAANVKVAEFPQLVDSLAAPLPRANDESPGES